VHKIQTGVSKICKFFTEAGLPVGEKVLTIRVPKIIMETVDSVISKAFLRGYFDADGCLLFERARINGRCVEFKKIHHYYPRIVLCSVSKDLIVVDIKHMLKSAGLRYNICKVVPSGKGKHEGYFATINGATQVELWMREIGSSNPVHSSKYEVWKRFGFVLPEPPLNKE
jgi:intein/homing endonuclease